MLNKLRAGSVIYAVGPFFMWGVIMSDMRSYNYSSDQAGTAVDPVEKKSFSAGLLTALVYPLRGNGKFILLAWAVFVWVVGILKHLPLIGIISWPIVLGCLCAYCFSVISDSANGGDTPPGWPDMTDWWHDFIRPALFMNATVLACAGPFIVFAWYFSDIVDELPGQALLLVGLGVVYFPMAITAVTLRNSLSGLNPFFVLLSIAKVAPAYIVACLFMAFVVFLTFVALSLSPVSIPVIGPILINAFMLYAVMVLMYVCGLIFYVYEEKLGWNMT